MYEVRVSGGKGEGGREGGRGGEGRGGEGRGGEGRLLKKYHCLCPCRSIYKVISGVCTRAMLSSKYSMMMF